MIKYNYAPKTAIGGRKENQDTEGSCVTKFGFLSVVCDGMGGAAGGKTASTMAVNIIMQEVLNSSSNMPAQALMMAIKKANQEIYNRGRQQSELRGMGTTATALIINDEKVTIAHAGDSRVYQLRDGQKVFRTNDHSKVFELVKRGILSEEQARLSEESNIIQRALGIAPDIEVEINDNIPFLKGDLFMLCTDGVCGALPEEDLLKLLKKEKDIKQLSESVIRQIDLLGNQQGGGHDNLTLAFVKPLSNSKLDVIIDMKTKITIYSLAAMVALLALTVGYLLISDNSKRQIAELQLEVKTLKESLAKAIDKTVKGQNVTDTTAIPGRGDNTNSGSSNPKGSADGDLQRELKEREEMAARVRREDQEKTINEQKQKEKEQKEKERRKNEEKELNKPDSPQSDSSPNREEDYVVEELSVGETSQGHHILKKYGIDDSYKKINELIKLNPKIDFGKLDTGQSIHVILPKK